MTITVNIPLEMESFVQAKSSEEHASPEGYLLSLLEMVQSEEKAAHETIASMGASRREALEATLEDRLNGPFVPLAERWKERVLAKASGSTR
jgi:hypothetical protein